jgi:hypothetical protein
MRREGKSARSKVAVRPSIAWCAAFAPRPNDVTSAGVVHSVELGHRLLGSIGSPPGEGRFFLLALKAPRSRFTGGPEGGHGVGGGEGGGGGGGEG